MRFLPILIQKYLTRKRGKIIFVLFLILSFAIIVCLPDPLFQDPLSTVLLDKNAELLGAKIAKDGQWRFPEIKELPEKYIKAVTTFEDKRFFYHPGFDPISLFRAFTQNIKAGKYVSGGSTISMQTIRISRKNKARTLLEKCIEIVLAVRLESKYSKKKILALYASNAPYGGNVVGLETASWRFFGKNAKELTWAETCMLAVLPNNPGSIFPGKNRLLLLAKRNKLLKRLFQEKVIDLNTYKFACEEDLPSTPTPLPRWTPQLVEHFAQNPNHQNKEKIKTCLDLKLQKKIGEIGQKHLEQLKINDIHNFAILVIDNQTNEVRAYLGNADNTGQANNEDVDIVQASRSTGSLLKPILYAKALDQGLILPNSILPDIPTQFGGYKPENFKLTYDGAVSAKRAIAKSLNVPFVKLLEQYGAPIFLHDLGKFGFTNLNPSPSYYGLTMIVGGIENSLWNICKAYAGMARTLTEYPKLNGAYHTNEFVDPQLISTSKIQHDKVTRQAPVVGAAAVWDAFEAMQGLERPDESGEWEKFDSSKKIAWKTGTSFGYRDAWAVGISPRYTVGVWVGNADGEGRPNLIGIFTAAPLMFDVFDILPDSPWFLEPFDDEIKIPVCTISGYRAGPYCIADSAFVPKNGQRAVVCKYHQRIFTNQAQTERLNLDCASQDELKAVDWFVLNPIEEFYFKSQNAWYVPLPPYRNGCNPNIVGRNLMNMIYPKDLSTVFIPRLADGMKGELVLQAAHQLRNAKIRWFIDEKYEGETEYPHKLSLTPANGAHILSIVDDAGYRFVIRFTVKDASVKSNSVLK